MPLDGTVPRYCSDFPSYRIADDRQSIRFLPCGTVSFNRHDVAHRYCGRCHRFIDDDTARDRGVKG